MADTGSFRVHPLQGWQREAILKVAALLRDKFGNPPADAAARRAHDDLLEVLDPARRTVRLRKEIAEATRKPPATERPKRSARERRVATRRQPGKGAPEGWPERRTGERRIRSRRKG